MVPILTLAGVSASVMMLTQPITAFLVHGFFSLFGG